MPGIWFTTTPSRPGGPSETAKALRLTIPQSLLVSDDKVIE